MSKSVRPISSIISLCLIVVAVVMEFMGISMLRDNLPKLYSKDLGTLIQFFVVIIPNTIFLVIATIAAAMNIGPSNRARGNLTPILRILGIITFILNLLIIVINGILIYMLATKNDGFYQWLAKFLQTLPIK